MPAFVDTNILVYAEDRDAGDKHTIARHLVTDLWHSGEGVLSIQVLLLGGIRLASTLKVSFWDALMIHAARVARCDRLWTEDLNHGQQIGDLVIVNPFLPLPG